MKNLRVGPTIAPSNGRRSIMNSDQVEGKWKQVKGAVKQQWGKLTDDDLTVLSGKKDELIGKLQERYGYTREQATKEADAWAAKSQYAWDDHIHPVGTGYTTKI
jgi:uncharacterized protein YjbJ (UPF0337 family)